jgi:ribosome maturation protein SDO1
MSDNYTLVRYQYEGDKFEILVDPDKGLLYKRGELGEVSNALLIDTIFTDAGKGEKASSSKLSGLWNR